MNLEKAVESFISSEWVIIGDYKKSKSKRERETMQYKIKTNAQRLQENMRSYQQYKDSLPEKNDKLNGILDKAGMIDDIVNSDCVNCKTQAKFMIEEAINTRNDYIRAKNDYLHAKYEASYQRGRHFELYAEFLKEHPNLTPKQQKEYIENLRGY